LGELRDFVHDFTERNEWSADVRLQDGKPIQITAFPLVSNATMLRFSVIDHPPEHSTLPSRDIPAQTET
jgi:hypothetical protein